MGTGIERTRGNWRRSRDGGLQPSSKGCSTECWRGWVSQTPPNSILPQDDLEHHKQDEEGGTVNYSRAQRRKASSKTGLKTDHHALFYTLQYHLTLRQWKSINVHLGTKEIITTCKMLPSGKRSKGCMGSPCIMSYSSIWLYTYLHRNFSLKKE